jgi:hypothetical protein
MSRTTLATMVAALTVAVGGCGGDEPPKAGGTSPPAGAAPAPDAGKAAEVPPADLKGLKAQSPADTPPP